MQIHDFPDNPPDSSWILDSADDFATWKLKITHGGERCQPEDNRITSYFVIWVKALILETVYYIKSLPY